MNTPQEYKELADKVAFAVMDITSFQQFYVDLSPIISSLKNIYKYSYPQTLYNQTTTTQKYTQAMLNKIDTVTPFFSTTSSNQQLVIFVSRMQQLIVDNTSYTIDQYLQINSICVYQEFADISAQAGFNISAQNICAPLTPVPTVFGVKIDSGDNVYVYEQVPIII